ncbi:MAG: hypothetical protein V8Q57_09350 [Blautia sp.]
MNTQRFYLYLNLTKPGQKLILSYCTSNGKGEPVSPAYLIHSILAMFPKCQVEEAEEKEYTLDGMELPATSMSCFLKGLEEGKKDPLFAELYSWYLLHPEYENKVRSLVEASLARKPADKISESVAKALYGRFPLMEPPGWSDFRPVPLHIFCSMDFCLPSVLSMNLKLWIVEM